MGTVQIYEGPYYKLKDAATYCGYESADGFRRAIEEYDVPRVGPKNNRYPKEALDRFMNNPMEFTVQKYYTRNRKPIDITIN